MSLTVKRRLELYADVLKIVHKDKVSQYPFNIMSRDEISHTLNEIELKYQASKGAYTTRNATDHRITKGGSANESMIYVFTM